MGTRARSTAQADGVLWLIGTATVVGFLVRLGLRPLLIAIPHSVMMLVKSISGQELQNYETGGALWNLIVKDWGATNASVVSMVLGLVLGMLWIGNRDGRGRVLNGFLLGSVLLCSYQMIASAIWGTFGGNLFPYAVALVQALVTAWLVDRALTKTAKKVNL